MKFITLVLLSLVFASCASNRKCEDEKCAKDDQEQRQHFFEAGSLRR